MKTATTIIRNNKRIKIESLEGAIYKGLREFNRKLEILENMQKNKLHTVQKTLFKNTLFDAKQLYKRLENFVNIENAKRYNKLRIANVKVHSKN